MATIYEVAAKAGVSPATVSRVFNGITVRPGYAERVRAAAEELSFVPNRTARRLRRQASEVIALVIPDIENPFFTALARGVEDRAMAGGFSVVLCNSDEQPEKETRYLQVALSEHMAGVVLAPAGDHPELDALLGRSTPVVVVDRQAPHHDLDTVVMDDEAIGRDETLRLYDGGAALVACITGPTGVGTAHRRAEGWAEAFASRSPDADPATYLERADYRVEGGHTAMERLLDLPTPPDAVLVANNLMGVGATRALAERSSDVTLLILGDLPFGMFPRPGSRVVPLPARRLGTEAADLLLARIKGDRTPTRTVVLDAGL
ncbi:LacI family DNA-binding transcriptional regulator [Nocardioides sp. CER19]|uniref:LacI family DNA-binding transcriptional regulator n=1 Tax=Nocardioides sp. CER19 TaxID=3038538 RepID=UPI00244A53E8|nr:LacI family DNA-binding transcriptional regulator [Nocardioides sp. CER19]MDH2412756.1 LacI family DNA-binding transcriptional regulator [Nocardioides sp. CER19]